MRVVGYALSGGAGSASKATAAVALGADEGWKVVVVGSVVVQWRDSVTVARRR